MNNSLVTIGITSFNSFNSITDAINSALMQTWHPLEILIVDDCSSDGTWDVILNLTKKYESLRIFRNEINRGVANCRNRIIEESRGEFIAFFDDDDVSLPDRILSQYLRIVSYENHFSNGDHVICHTARKLVYSQEKSLLEPTIGEKQEQKSPSGVAVALRILSGKSLIDGYGSCATCSQMARVKTYKSVGSFDENLRRSEDTDFNIRLSILGGHFVGISKPLVVQRMTKKEEKSLDEEYRNGMLLILKHKEFIQNYVDYNFCKSFLDIKYLWLKKNYIFFSLNLIKLMSKYPILTISRLYLAKKNIKSNILFSKFHQGF